MAMDITNGLAYLAEMKFVHRYVYIAASYRSYLTFISIKHLRLVSLDSSSVTQSW